MSIENLPRELLYIVIKLLMESLKGNSSNLCTDLNAFCKAYPLACANDLFWREAFATAFGIDKVGCNPTPLSKFAPSLTWRSAFEGVCEAMRVQKEKGRWPRQEYHLTVTSSNVAQWTQTQLDAALWDIYYENGNCHGPLAMLMKARGAKLERHELRIRLSHRLLRSATAFDTTEMNLLIEKGGFADYTVDRRLPFANWIIDEEGYTALHGAMLVHNNPTLAVNVARILLNNGACDIINSVSYKGKTPLIFAAHVGNVEMIELLLEKKAFPNVAGNFPLLGGHQYALHAAIEGRHVNAVSLLLKRGANPKLQAYLGTAREVDNRCNTQRRHSLQPKSFVIRKLLCDAEKVTTYPADDFVDATKEMATRVALSPQ